MISGGVRSLYVRASDGAESIRRGDVVKGLSSKDIAEKTRSFNALVLSILSDPSGDHHLVAVINHILPYQTRSLALKRALIVYCEVVQRQRADGTPLAEFMLMGNSMRNDINHANEHVVALALKLAGRTALRETLEALFGSVLEKLDHLECFVRRNALECLAELHTRFGDALPELTPRIEAFLRRETEANCVRNALNLLFRLDAARALAFVEGRVELVGAEDFSEVGQLAVVRGAAAATRERSLRSRATRLLRRILESRHDSVVFEAATAIAGLSREAEALGECAAQLLRVARNSADINVKLLILESLGASFVEERRQRSFQLELVEMVQREPAEVALKAIELLKDEMDGETVSAFVSVARCVLAHGGDANDDTVELQCRLWTLLASALPSVAQSSVKTLLELTSNAMRLSTKQMRLVEAAKAFIIAAVRAPLLAASAPKVLAEFFLEFGNTEIAQLALSLISRSAAIEDCERLLNDICAEPLTSAAEPSNAQLTAKTVVREDGTYDTQVGAARTVRGALGRTLMTDGAFAVSFLRGCSALVGRVPSSQRFRAHLLCLLLQIYAANERAESGDAFLFTELRLLAEDLVNGSGELPIFELAPSPTERPLKVSPRASPFEERFDFRLLAAGEETVDEESAASPSTLQNVVQLTGYGDPLYIEAAVKFNRNDIALSVYVLNRTAAVLKNVHIAFFSVNQRDGRTVLRAMDAVGWGHLPPGAAATLPKTLTYDSTREYQFFAEVSCQNNAGVVLSRMKTATVAFSLTEFLTEGDIAATAFRALWPQCEWEAKLSLRRRCASPAELLRELEALLRMRAVAALTIDAGQFTTFSLYARFLLGRDLLLNASVEAGDGFCAAELRLRSQNMGAVVLARKALKAFNQF